MTDAETVEATVLISTSYITHGSRLHEWQEVVHGSLMVTLIIRKYTYFINILYVLAQSGSSDNRLGEKGVILVV